MKKLVYITVAINCRDSESDNDVESVISEIQSALEYENAGNIVSYTFEDCEE